MFNIIKTVCSLRAPCTMVRQTISQKNISRVTTSSNFSTTNSCYGLEEFFDSEENWGKSSIKSGRSWKKEELRLKSNEDLHKLWYVLLKEKNMLLTMDHAYKKNYVVFPNEERIDKVEDSMENLELVVRERNRAYWLLEVGEIEERPIKPVTDSFGLTKDRALTEHAIPQELHPDCKPPPECRGMPKEFFLRRMNEEYNKKKKKHDKLIRSHIAKLCALYPDIDMELLQAEYPDFDVYEIKESREARGNHNNNYN